MSKVVVKWITLCALLALVINTVRISRTKAEESFRVSEDDVTGVLKFVTEHGGVVLPALQAVYTPNAGWGLVFNDNVAPQDPSKTYRTLIRIPRKLLLCNTTDGETNLVENVLTAYKTNMTFWAPYFKSIPFQMDLLWSWTDEEMKELDNPYLTKHVLREIKGMRQKFRKLQKQLPFEFSWSDFTLVYSWVASRAFNVESWHCLAPFADMPNHLPTAPDAYWDWYQDKTTNEMYFRIRSAALARKGEEFRIAYLSRLTNEDALTEYGFADIDSKVQRMSFLHPLDAYNLKAKESLMSELTLQYEPDPHLILTFFRIYTATAEELDTHFDRRHFKLPSSRARELEAAEACSQAMHRMRPRGKLLEKEFSYLYDKSLGYRKKMVLAYAISYDRLYQRTSQFCERYAELARCSTLSRLKRVWRQPRLKAIPKDLGSIIYDLYEGGNADLCR